MNDLQKTGGFAALIGAATYIIGFALAFTLLAESWELNPTQYVAFLVENQTLLYIWHLLIYVVNGVFLVFLVLALHQRLQTGAPSMALGATAFGMIWAVTVIMSGMLIINDLGVVADLFSQNPDQAVTVWLALDAVESGIGGGIELPGGLWILLISWAALRAGQLPKALNYLGLVIGISGLLTAVPPLYEAGNLFGLGFIVWFAWVGIYLLRNSSGETVGRTAVLSPQQSLS
jgi:hypothetical protein